MDTISATLSALEDADSAAIFDVIVCLLSDVVPVDSRDSSMIEVQLWSMSQLRGFSHSTYLFVLSFLLSLCALVYSTTVYIVRVTPIIQSIRLHTLLCNSR